MARFGSLSHHRAGLCVWSRCAGAGAGGAIWLTASPALSTITTLVVRSPACTATVMHGRIAAWEEPPSRSNTTAGSSRAAGRWPRYLAPLLGRNVTTISVRLSRYDGDIAKVVDARQNRGMGRAPKPIEYDGRQFPSRRALAKYLSPLLGRSVTTLTSLLSRYDGDIAKVVRAASPAPAHGVRGRCVPDPQGAGAISRAAPRSPPRGRPKAVARSPRRCRCGAPRQALSTAVQGGDSRSLAPPNATACGSTRAASGIAALKPLTRMPLSDSIVS